MANRRDVQLVIRAKDEATRAVDSIASSLAALLQQQNNTGSGAKKLSSDLGGMVAALADVERANGLVGNAADRAEKSFKRQQATLAESRAQLQSTKTQIEGVGRAIEAAQRKIVDTVLEGGDTSGLIQQINAANAALKTLITTEGRLTTSVRAQEASLGEQRSSLQQIGSLANATEAAIQSLGSETERAALRGKAALEAETKAFREQAAAARDAANAARNNDKFSNFMGVDAAPGKSAASSAAVFADQEAMAQAAQRLRDRIDPLAAIIRKQNDELANANRLFKQGKLSANELAIATDHFAKEADDARAALDRIGKGEKGAIGLFGLKPYELTNLGYQVNDVITQLASGTSLTQVLAQQGGQILQLLPNIGTRITAALSNPAFLGAAAVIAGIAVVLNRAATEAERLRKIEGILAGISDGAEYSAQTLNLTVKALEKLGFTSEQALGQVRSFLTQGLNPDYLLAFGQAAADISLLTGKDLPEAAAMMRDAFSSGYDAVAKLDDEFQFLTASEREQIKAMFDSGRAAEARETAFRAFNDSLRDSKKAADEAKGAIASLGSAVNDFLTWLANTGAVKTFTDSVRKEFKDLARDIRAFAGTASLDDLNVKIADVQSKIDKIRNGRFLYIPGVENFTVKQATLLAVAQGELNDLLEQRTQIQKQLAKATGDTVNQESAAVRKTRQDRLDAIELERRLATTEDEKQKIKLQGEQAYQEEMRKSGDSIIAAAKRQAKIDEENHKLRMKRLKEEQREREKTIAFGSPVAGGRVTSGFGRRNAPNTPNGKGSTNHAGIDYAVPVGTPVVAPAQGVVKEIGQSPSRGKFVVLSHGSGTETHFYHLSDNKIKEIGELVNKGELFAKSGNTGHSSGPHLHYGVKENGKFVDPNKGRFKGDLGGVLADAENIESKRIERQDDFNLKLDAEAEKRRQATAYLREQQQLGGEALFEAKKREAINNAVLAAQQEATKQQIELDDERRKIIEETVAAEWEIANAKDRATSGVNDASGERQALLERLALATELGDTAGMAALELQIDEVDKALELAIEKAIQFWKAFNTPESRIALAGLQNLRESLKLDDRQREQQKVDKPLNDLQNMRSALQEQIQFYQDMGQSNVVEVLREQLRGIDADTLSAIDNSLRFWQTQSGPEAQAAILNLQNMRNQIIAARDEFAISAGQIQQAFAGSLSDSIKLFAQRLVETRNPIRALGEAVLNFAASFIEKIADMMLQMFALRVAMKIGFGGFTDKVNDVFGGAIVKDAAKSMVGAAIAWKLTAASIQAAAASLAASNAAGGATGGGGGFLGKLIGIGASLFGGSVLPGVSNASLDSFFNANAAIFHSGGIAGSGNRSRAVSPAWFSSAVRYHGGGIAGLRPNEVPTILERGEEILTRSDARHRMNGGGASGPAPEPKVDLKIVNAIDSAAVVEAGLNSRSGQKVLLNFFRANSRAINAAMQEG